MARTLAAFSVLVTFASVCASPLSTLTSILQPLPKHIKEGDSPVAFVKDRLNVLPEGFKHTEDGILLYTLLIVEISLSSKSLSQIAKSKRTWLE